LRRRTKAPGSDAIDFDDYSHNYRDALNRSIHISGEKDDFFDIYKVVCLKRWAFDPHGEGFILDFGCGIGKLTRHLSQTYKKSIVHGYDISAGSIALARENWGHLPNTVFTGALSEDNRYDLIVAANVFHHIPRQDRPAALIRLRTLLKPEGKIAVFEHNPLNPLTRYAVGRCSFDVGVKLIGLRQFVKLAIQSKLDIQMKRYILFFPKKMKAFRKFEPMLGFFPMGAQYTMILNRHQRNIHL
jgi:2-polyprenyl-3-methyl-5-hydroxy-6-metoxy-1,4-benzoquinol methylase